MRSSLRCLLRELAAVGRFRPFLYGAVHLSERVLLVGGAWAFTRHYAVPTSWLTAGFTALMMCRAGIASSNTFAMEAHLHRRAMERLLSSAPPSARAAFERDPQTTIFEGNEHGARLGATLIPGVIADAVATFVTLFLFVTILPLALVAVSATAMLLAIGALVVAQRLVRAETLRIWIAQGTIIDGLVAALGARFELVANGVNDTFLSQRLTELSEYANLGRKSSFRIGLANRLPMVIAVAVVVIVLALGRSVNDRVMGEALTHAALFVAALPAVAGVARGALEVGRSLIHFAPFSVLLDGEPPSPNPTTVIHENDLDANDATIEWRDVSIRYPGAAKLALSEVYLTWHRSDILVFRGPNGSGKSTFLSSLLGLANLESGVLLVRGIDLTTSCRADWHKRIAYLPQRPFFPPRTTVGANLQMFAPTSTPFDQEEALRRVEAWSFLDEKAKSATGLNTPLDVPIDSLSTGERQRIAMARILIHPDKKLVLLDEPDANLDRSGVRLFARLVQMLARSGRWVAIAAHTEEVVAVGDLIVTLEMGRVVSSSSNVADVG